jgi:hypothetical protein
MPLASALDDLCRHLEICADNVESLETLILELIGRAGAQGDASVVERAQAVDALAQQLRRLAAATRELASGAAEPEPLKETLAVLARRLQPAKDAGDVDLF